MFPIISLPSNFNLNDARNGLYYTTSSAIVATLVNKPDNWPKGEISVLSVHNNYGAFQVAIQTNYDSMSLKKRTYSDYIGWSTWTSV